LITKLLQKLTSSVVTADSAPVVIILTSLALAAAAVADGDGDAAVALPVGS